MLSHLFLPKSVESAADVRKGYASRINLFFQKVTGSSHQTPRTEGDPLDKLFSWAQGISESSMILQSELDAETNKRQRAEKKMESLQKELEVTSSRLQKATIENRNASMAHEKEAQVLIGQLLVNTDDNLAWTDDKLKHKFGSLQYIVEKVSSPRRLEFRLPPNQLLDEKLDPTNFVTRHGKGKFHMLLKSMIWTAIAEHFFSERFGFGSLGPGRGKTELLDALKVWQKLFELKEGAIDEEVTPFALFESQKIANNWRSSTFQCIDAAINTGGTLDIVKTGVVAAIHHENLEQTVKRITAIFKEITILCGTTFQAETEHQIREISQLASEIAVQFGIHPAQLVFSAPKRGSRVEIGPEFHDYQDGDFALGSTPKVDIVVNPGLQKIGDGRGDMASVRVIVPCEFYPI